jgi:hypothetical protein
VKRGVVMITISKKDSIYKLVTNYPQIKEIMTKLGFSDIIKPGMIQSVGRIMNLEKGCKMKDMNMSEIVDIFHAYGFELE